MPADGWSWKVEARALNPRLDLRYEPGAWGDVLKGLWAVAAARALAARAGPGAPLRVLDAFAGAPRYPRLPAAAGRLVLVEGLTGLSPPAADLVRAWRAAADAEGREAWASTARLVVAAARAAGAAPALAVVEADPARRAAWAAEADARVLDLPGGAAALGAAARVPAADGPGAAPDLVLVDPYDLVAEWPALRAPLAATPGVLVLYLFNRAPRGAGVLRDYRALRADLAARVAPRVVACGRTPSDAVLPRAWHEALLVAEPAALEAVAAPLTEVTRALAARLAADGAVD